jgi:hypothetical protein
MHRNGQSRKPFTACSRTARAKVTFMVSKPLGVKFFF